MTNGLQAPLETELHDFLSSTRHRLPHQAWLAPWPSVRNLVWRRLSSSARDRVRLWTLRTFATVAENPPAVEPIYVLGPMTSRTGIAEGTRLQCEAMLRLGRAVRTVDLPVLPEEDTPAAGLRPIESGPGTLVIHGGPDSLGRLLPTIGRRALRGKRIIGNWNWELPTIPEHWVPALAYVDEVWSPSRFVADAIQARTSKPIRIVPYPVAITPPGRRRRAHFGFAPDAFVVLCVFSMSSCFERKNPVAAVNAFKLAFGDRSNARLLLKVSDMASLPSAQSRLLEAVGTATNIRVIDDGLSRTEARDLVASADVVLSLHRAEGFGLALAEAMLSGTPVIATNWSGNLDFMDEDVAGLVRAGLVSAHDPHGQWVHPGEWAEPDIEHAAALLRRFANNAGAHEARRGRAMARVTERLGLEAFARAIGPAFAAASAGA